MNSINKGSAEKSFDELFKSIDESEQLAVEARVLMYRFLGEVDRVCKIRGINRKELAARLGTSASYITQLFQGKKFVNFQMLAKIQKVLDITFSVAVLEKQKQVAEKKKQKVTQVAEAWRKGTLRANSA